MVSSDFDSINPMKNKLGNMPISDPRHKLESQQSTNKNTNSQSTFRFSSLPSKDHQKSNKYSDQIKNILLDQNCLSNKQQSYPSTIRYHTKHSYQHADNDERTDEIDAESCSLERALNRRFLDKFEYFT